MIVLLVNGCGAAVIIRQDKMRQPSHAQLEVVQVRRLNHPQDTSHFCAQVTAVHKNAYKVPDKS